jgi:hypothetical protein
MFRRGTTVASKAQALAIVLSYVFAFHLIITGLANATRASANAGPQALLDPHAFCVVDPEQGSFGGGSSSNPDHNKTCCTLICGVALLLTPAAFAVVAYYASAAMPAYGARDLGPPHLIAAPGSGQGPRAPPLA